MAAWEATPHVAQPLATLDPHAAALAPAPSATTAADSAALLARARPVIRALAEAANFPDLVTKPTTHRALSNLGDFLMGHREDPVRGEAHRALLMDATVDEETVLSLIDEEGRQTIDRPRATLKRKPLRRLSIEDMDALEDPVDRLKCVPIQGQAAVATVVTGLASTGAEVDIVYTTGAALTLRRNADVPGDPRPSVSMVIKSITKQHKVISGQLDAGLARVVEELFSRGGVVPLAPGIDPKDDFARAVFIGAGADKPAYYDMPAWFQEHLGCLGEELFRLHALLTAAHCVRKVRSGEAKAGVDAVRARTVCVDRAMLFEQFDQKKFKRESGLALKVVLHAASARSPTRSRCCWRRQRWSVWRGITARRGRWRHARTRRASRRALPPSRSRYSVRAAQPSLLLWRSSLGTIFESYNAQGLKSASEAFASDTRPWCAYVGRNG